MSACNHYLFAWLMDTTRLFVVLTIAGSIGGAAKAGKNNMKKLAEYLKKEAVLCASLLLAAISACFTPPDREYPGYIDFRTLAILFCLMSVMAGLQKLGIFRQIAGGLLGKVRSVGSLVLVLMLLCFFSSMLITNDVALLLLFYLLSGL